MLNEKKAGLPVTKQRELPRIVAGTDLMAALRQSIEKAREAAPKPTPAGKPAVAPKGKKVAKRNPDQREMLLPIAGGGPKKEVAEKQLAKASARKKAG
jgi:DNA end-binding protein Ku